MKKFIWLAPVLILILSAAACSSTAFETGDISFVSNGLTYHDSGTPAQIVIHSSFETDKIAMVSLNGVQIYQCNLIANADTTCPPLTLTDPGEYNITAEVQRQDGDYVSTQTTATLSPYTALDRMAQTVAGGDGKDPALGYAIMIAVLVVISVITLAAIGAKLTNGSSQGLGIGATIGFFTSLVLLAIAVYSNASPGLAVLVVGSIVGIIVVSMIAMVLINATNKGYTITSPQADITLMHPDGRIETGSFKQPFLGPGQNSPNLTGAAESFTKRSSGRPRQLSDIPDYPQLED